MRRENGRLKWTETEPEDLVIARENPLAFEGALNSHREYKQWLHVCTQQGQSVLSLPYPFAGKVIEESLILSYYYMTRYVGWPAQWWSFKDHIRFLMATRERAREFSDTFGPPHWELNSQMVPTKLIRLVPVPKEIVDAFV